MNDFSFGGEFAVRLGRDHRQKIGDEIAGANVGVSVMLSCDAILTIGQLVTATIMSSNLRLHPDLDHERAASIIDALFHFKWLFASMNALLALPFLFIFAKNRDIRSSLGRMYPDEGSFEKAFKVLAGAALFTSLIAVLLCVALVSAQPSHNRTAILQLVTAFQSPFVIALLLPRTIMLGSIVNDLYRGM